VPTRLLLEGPDIETLLARVRDEHGPDARIVSADKVRSGGLGGFFTRQKFEIAVEVGAAAEPATPEPVAESVAALVERADRVEARGNATDPLAVPLPSTERPEFSDLLASLRRRTAGPTVLPAAPASPAAPVILPAANGLAPAPPVIAAPNVAAAVPATLASAAPAAANGVAAAPPAAAPVVLPSANGLAERPADGPAPIVGDLLALGVPEHLARLATGSDRYAAALRALSALPPLPAPPAAAGDVLVIAGEPAPALALAAALAAEINADPARTLVAAPSAAGLGVPAARRIPSVQAAERRADRLHAADSPQIVVVAAPVDRTGGEWAGAVARALRANGVWALVDCTRKPADLRRHLRALGWVDALAAHGADSSADPATVLDLGVPVTYVDGRPATATTWAALLCERLTAGQGR
jgi:hypothetical protein